MFEQARSMSSIEFCGLKILIFVCEPQPSLAIKFVSPKLQNKSFESER